MRDKPRLIIYREQAFSVGQDTFIDSTTENANAVVFEDNKETGYFYAINRENGLEILDALHIYNVADVVDQNKTSTLKILWSEDQNPAIIKIGGRHISRFMKQLATQVKAQLHPLTYYAQLSFGADFGFSQHVHRACYG